MPFFVYVILVTIGIALTMLVNNLKLKRCKTRITQLEEKINIKNS